MPVNLPWHWCKHVSRRVAITSAPDASGLFKAEYLKHLKQTSASCAGLVGNLVGVAPATAVFMAVYEPIKQEVAKRVPDNRSFLGPLTAGAASGLAASLIRVPTEVVKQRMQSGE